MPEPITAETGLAWLCFDCAFHAIRMRFIHLSGPLHDCHDFAAAGGRERLNKKLKRRTRFATLFPNIDSWQPLVIALLAEQDEEWMTAKNYLNMKP